MSTSKPEQSKSNKSHSSIRVPMSSPDITDAERRAVAAVLQTPYLSMGGEIQSFEDSVREYCGSAHAIGVSSGTAGLHLCIRAAGIESGDLVITTPFSFVASTNVILFEGAIPVFVDVDPETGNIDPVQVEKAVTDINSADPKVASNWLPRKIHHTNQDSGNIRSTERSSRLKAILPVDVFGQPADLDPIVGLADKYNLRVIEDSCEALGAEYKGRRAGTLGDYGVYAFYPNKQITTGEGAMIVTDDDQAAHLMRSLRNQGRAPGDTWLQHTYLGYNYRLDEMSAALGSVQMSRLDELLNKRQSVADWYAERLAALPGVETLPVKPTTTRMSWFVYVIRLASHIDRDLIAIKLSERGIPARPYFMPIHLQPYLVERFGYLEGDYPVTEDLGRRGLAIPFSGVMSRAQVDIICDALDDILKGM